MHRHTRSHQFPKTSTGCNLQYSSSSLAALTECWNVEMKNTFSFQRIELCEGKLTVFCTFQEYSKFSHINFKKYHVGICFSTQPFHFFQKVSKFLTPCKHICKCSKRKVAEFLWMHKVLLLSFHSVLRGHLVTMKVPLLWGGTFQFLECSVVAVLYAP
jgi:hypothetical protein